MSDERLIDCDTKAEIEENFNRILSLIDAIDERITTLETAAE